MILRRGGTTANLDCLPARPHSCQKGSDSVSCWVRVGGGSTYCSEHWWQEYELEMSILRTPPGKGVCAYGNPAQALQAY